jgi:hypothetical protein
MKNAQLLFFAVTFFSSVSFSQTNTFPSTGAAGIGTTTPDVSSLLEIRSTSKGLLILRMTQTGKSIKQFRDLPHGDGSITIEANSLTPGSYLYTLMIDGKTIATKQMERLT